MPTMKSQQVAVPLLLAAASRLFAVLGWSWAPAGKLLSDAAAPLLKDGQHVEIIAASLKNSSPFAIPILLALAVATSRLNVAVGGKIDWEAVDNALERFRANLFGNGGRPHAEQRITLFQHKTFRLSSPLKRGWLVPVSRSSYTSQKSHSVWRAPNDGQDAEGVAGKCWGCSGITPLNELPDVSRRNINCTEGIYREYAEATGCTIAWVKKNRPTARSLLAFPVEAKSKKNGLWGVLVIDSSDQQIDLEKAKSDFNAIKALFGHIL